MAEGLGRSACRSSSALTSSPLITFLPFTSSIVHHYITLSDTRAAYIVSAVPAFPPVTPGELNARAIIEAIFAKSDKGVILESECFSTRVVLLVTRSCCSRAGRKCRKSSTLTYRRRAVCYFPHPWTELAQIAQDQSWNVVTGEQAMICTSPPR